LFLGCLFCRFYGVGTSVYLYVFVPANMPKCLQRVSMFTLGAARAGR